MEKIYIVKVYQSELGKRLFNETWSSRNVYFRSRKNAVDFVKSFDEYEEGYIEPETVTAEELEEITRLYGFNDALK